MLPALLVGVLLASLAPGASAHPRQGWRHPYFGYPPPYDWRWGPSGYWGPGIDHPYYQPWIPYPQGRRGDPGSRFDRWMEEGYQAFRRGEVTIARHRFEEARDLARDRWGAESRQALAASRALAALRAPEGEAGPEATPTPSKAPELPEPSPEVADTLARIRARLEVARRARGR